MTPIPRRDLRAATLTMATMALNLDGGPLACQGILLDGYQRRFCGQWELAVHDGPSLLTDRWGARARVALPIVLAVVRRL